MQFQHRFAGKGGRLGKVEHQPCVNQACIGGPETMQFGTPWHRQATQQGAGNSRGIGSGDAYNADTTLAGWRGNGSNGIGGQADHGREGRLFPAALNAPRDHPLLGNGEGIVDHPVEHQAGREKGKKHGKNDG